MQELSMQEVSEVSGAGLVIPTFPAGPGLVAGTSTILAGAGFIIGVAGANVALGLTEALGWPHPAPYYGPGV